MADKPDNKTDAPAANSAAIKAWHEADTAEKKKAAVSQFPELENLYALAASIAAEK